MLAYIVELVIVAGIIIVGLSVTIFPVLRHVVGEIYKDLLSVKKSTLTRSKVDMRVRKWAINPGRRRGDQKDFSTSGFRF